MRHHTGPPVTTLRSRRLRLRALAPAASLLGALILAGCGSAAGTDASAPLRLGYLGNLTHAPALVGLAKGTLTSQLGVAVRTQTFNAGPQEVEALLGGSLDAAFIGPAPAVTAFTRSHGGIRIVSGAVAGGAGLVVRADRGITSASDLRGRTLATPQLGNTQDVALRTYLADHGIATDPEGGGDAKIAPADNATIVQLFETGRIDGAWVPEPTLSRLVVEGHGSLLVDEATTWAQGLFPTTELVVTTQLLDTRPAVVRALVAGLRATVAYLNADPAAAKATARGELARISGKALPAAVVDAAWGRLQFSVDPLLPQLLAGSKNAVRVRTLPSEPDLHGIWAPQPLAASGAPAVPDAGLGATG